MSSKVQSILFDNTKFSVKKAVKWLQDNDFKVIKIDETPNFHRFRQITPAKVKKDGLNHYMSKRMGNGIIFVIAYKGSLKGGKLSVENIQGLLQETYKTPPKDRVGDFEIDKELSTPTTKVYYNPSTGESAVAHRGTKGIWDWSNNIAYATGLYDYTDRYKQAEKTQKAAEDKYGAQNISTLGHSQGAVLSRKLGKNTKEIINVNPAWIGEKQLPNEYNIRSRADPVSSLLYPYSTLYDYLNPSFSTEHNITIPSKSWYSPLAEHKVNILERLDPRKMIGAGLSKRQQIKDYGNMVKHLTSHIIDPNEPIDKKDFQQSKYLINQIMKIKN